MTRIEKSIEIEAPVEKVWAFVTEIENFAKSMPPEMEFEVLSRDEGPPRVGFTAKVKAKAGGQVMDITDETTELVENKKYSGRQKGGSLKSMEHIYLLEPTERGTKLTFIQEYELPYSLLGKIIDKLMVQKEFNMAQDYSLKKTKELLERARRS